MHMLAEAERRSLLAAMGIDVYLLRQRGAGPTRIVDEEIAEPVAAPVASANPGNIALVVAHSGSAAADSHARLLHSALPLALGIPAARIAWIETDALGAFASPPSAPAYLALGTEPARALGEELSTMQQMSAVIAVADAPHACLASALARRALWQALKPVARHLRRNPH